MAANILVINYIPVTTYIGAYWIDTSIEIFINFPAHFHILRYIREVIYGGCCFVNQMYLLSFSNVHLYHIIINVNRDISLLTC